MKLSSAETLTQDYFLDFSSSFSKSDFIKFSTTIKSLWLSDSTLIFPIGSKRGKNQLDKHVAMRLNFVTGKTTRILTYPNCYQTCELYNERPLIVPNNNNIFCLFTYYDEIQKVHKQGALENSIEIPGSSGILPYERSKEMNHAYTREHEARSEKNINLIHLKSNFYIIIQKLPQEDVLKPIKYKYIIFSNEDNPISSGIFNEQIVGELAIPYKEGLLVPNPDLNKAIYYEIK